MENRNQGNGMPRAFLGFAAALGILLLGTLFLGLYASTLGSSRHIALAVLTILLSCLIQAVSFTYLTITFKLLAQAVHLWHMPKENLEPARVLKRRMTARLGVVVASILPTVATGAINWRGGSAANIHLILGFVTISAHLWALIGQYSIICENSQLVSSLLQRYGAVSTRGAARA